MNKKLYPPFEMGVSDLESYTMDAIFCVSQYYFRMREQEVMSERHDSILSGADPERTSSDPAGMLEEKKKYSYELQVGTLADRICKMV